MSVLDDSVSRSFRLNLEQQKKRAKDLFREARAGNPAARARFYACRAKDRTGAFDPVDLSLADAQWVIARELGLPSWPKLKSHITAMQSERVATGAPDGAVKTLHIRCGSDIAGRLTEAGFVGDFLEYSNPFCIGPVTGDPDQPEQIIARSQFLANNYSGIPLYTLPQIVNKMTLENDRLAAAYQQYERIVLWFEHDSYDQLILARCLDLFHTHRPRQLELISVNHFPGPMRFIGLGQLPSEALRLLWRSRKTVSVQQMVFAKMAWQAVKSSTPSKLAAIVRAQNAVLPDLRAALHRHIRELPSVQNGLALTEHLILDILAEGSRTLGRTFHQLMTEREPLPWLTDLIFAHVVGAMRRASEPAVTVAEAEAGPWYRGQLTMTDTGRHVLEGRRDWLSCAPPERWVGGVPIGHDAPGWRWNEAEMDAVMR